MVYFSLIESIKVYGKEVWANKNKLLTTEMDFWQRRLGRHD